MVKELLLFTGGAATGAGICYICIQQKYEKRYKQDWEELQGTIHEKEKAVEAREKLANELAVKNLPYGVDSVIKTDNPFGAEKLNGVHDYGEYYNPDTNKEKPAVAQNMASQGHSEKDAHPTDDDEGPYIITEEEFATEALWHDKIELYFWGSDRVLTDEEEEMMEPSIYDLIGDAAIAEVERTEDTVYVRNPRRAMDFQIIYTAKNWADTH